MQHNASWCLQLSTGWFVVLLEQCFPIRVPALTETYSSFFIYQCQLNNKMFFFKLKKQILRSSWLLVG